MLCTEFTGLSMKDWTLGDAVRAHSSEWHVPIRGSIGIQFGADGGCGLEVLEYDNASGSRAVFGTEEGGIVGCLAEIDIWIRSALGASCGRLFGKNIDSHSLAEMQVPLIDAAGRLDVGPLTTLPLLWRLSPDRTQADRSDSFVYAKAAALAVGARCWLRAFPTHLRMKEKSFSCALRVTDVLVLCRPQLFPFSTKMRVVEDDDDATCP